MVRKIAIWRIFEEKTSEERIDFIRNLGSNEYYNWIKIRQSFIDSKEWKEFSKKFKLNHPICQECNKKNSERTHHLELIKDSSIREGFLKPLEDELNFQALCIDCHEEKHPQVVEEAELRQLIEHSEEGDLFDSDEEAFLDAAGEGEDPMLQEMNRIADKDDLL